MPSFNPVVRNLWIREVEGFAEYLLTAHDCQRKTSDIQVCLTAFIHPVIKQVC